MINRETLELYDAQHPFRQAAIRIIEDLIEPELEESIEGVRYYNLEDAIVDIIDKEVRRTEW